MSPAESLGHPALSSRAYAPASPRKRATPQANRPVFHNAPRRRPGERRGGRGGARLGQDLGPRDLRHHGGDLIHQERARQDEHPLGGHEPVEAVDGLHQQRPVARQREELLRALRRGEWPEARARAAREDRGPEAHVASPRSGAWGRGGLSPSISAIRAVSLVGLNGLVRRAEASSLASSRTRSSPSAVSTMTESARVAAAPRSSRSRSNPEPSGRWRSSSSASTGARG